MNENEQVGGAPAPFVESDEERKEAMARAEEARAVQEQAAAGMEKAAASGKRIAPEASLRLFLSPQHSNTKFLVKAGELMSSRNPITGLVATTERRGDVKAEFVNGVLATQDPDVIEWCEAHGPNEDLHREYHQSRGESTRGCRAGHGVCCDAKDENASIWCELKAAQIPTASREATMAPGMDIDRILQGKAPTGVRIGGEGDRLIDSARATEAAQEAVQEKD